MNSHVHGSSAKAILYAFVANLVRHINALEARIKSEAPEVGWCFVELDNRD